LIRMILYQSILDFKSTYDHKKSKYITNNI
jgi:hypothetical protein